MYLERKIVGPVGQMITSTDRQVLCSHVHLQVLEEVVVLGHKAITVMVMIMGQTLQGNYSFMDKH